MPWWLRVPHYRLHLVDDRRLLARYIERAERQAGVTSFGRLGTYSYLDMDVSIGRALDAGGAASELLRPRK